MQRITLFTWGYYGWGNHTPQLVEAVDAVEASRGFNPPVFVDIRIRRTVRATGFQGHAFEELLGASRYRWMKSLGNKFIETHSGPRIQVADPSKAIELLELAFELSRSKQRILYFCGCQWPRIDGRITCHRATVAELVLSAAKKQSRAVEIVEWPGGYPGQINLNVAPQILAAVRKGRTNVQLEGVSKLAEIAATPWCSVATLHAAGEKLHRIVGPAFRQKGDWALPVLCRFSDPKKRLSDYQRESKELRRGWGLDLICSQL